MVVPVIPPAPPTYAKIDHLSTLSMRERNGTIVSLKRLAVVIGLQALDESDYRVLFTALEQAGIPPAGSTPLSKPGTRGFEHLFLTERNPTIVGDLGRCDVELLYEAPLTGDNQDLDVGNADGRVFGEMSVALQHVGTNFFYPDGDRTKKRETVVVGHLFDDKDVNFRNQYKEQGGEIRVMLPHPNFKFSGYVDNDRPWLIAKSLLGCVNDREFLGEPKKTWIVFHASWKFVGYSGSRLSRRYIMKWEIQNNPDGWNPTAMFIDQRTHRPPVGIRDELTFQGALPPGQTYGAKIVPYYKPVDFEKAFGVDFDQ